MALRIVRAEGEDAVVRPLRLWYSGRHAEALAALVAPESDANIDELGQLVELALAHDLKHATRMGDALVSWRTRPRPTGCSSARASACWTTSSRSVPTPG